MLSEQILRFDELGLHHRIDDLVPHLRQRANLAQIKFQVVLGDEVFKFVLAHVLNVVGGDRRRLLR